MTEKFFLVKVTVAPETRFSGNFDDNSVRCYLERKLTAAMAFYTEGPEPLVECNLIDHTRHGDTERILRGGR